MNELEELLQHHGVKGMKWGVRRAVSSAGKALNRNMNKRRAREDASAERYHEKKKNSKVYKLNYNYHKKRAKGTPEQKHKAAVRAVRRDSFNKAVMVGMALTPAASKSAQVAGKAFARGVYKAATSPEAVRAGKNIINAVKRSPVRVVDGKSMKNVVDMVNAVAIRR